MSKREAELEAFMRETVRAFAVAEARQDREFRNFLAHCVDGNSRPSKKFRGETEALYRPEP